MFDRFRRVVRRGPVVVAAVTTLAVGLAGCANQDAKHQQSALHPDGPAAHKILRLTTPFFWIAVVIGIGVVGATIFLALRFREKPGEDRSPKQIHGHSTLEITWTIVPALILAVMGIFTIATIFDLSKEPKGANVVHVNVTGKQWWWEFDYTNAAKKTQFATANEMHIPINTPVYLTMTGADVIHSFWVPNLAGKKDVVPGRTSYLTIEGSKIGEYSGQCAEYCGLSHANMHFKVFVDSRADYDTWVSNQEASRTAELSKTILSKSGANSIYGCTQCHTFDPNVTGTRGPNLTHVGDRTTFAAGTYDMTLDNLTKWIHNAPSRKPMEQGPDPRNPLVGMPDFQKWGMTESEARDIAKQLYCATATNPSAEWGCS
jgi:cytochrome c oxidase subunit 2